MTNYELLRWLVETPSRDIHQLPRNSVETTYTTSPDQTDGMKLKV